jgi:hypothetical protein
MMPLKLKSRSFAPAGVYARVMRLVLFLAGLSSAGTVEAVPVLPVIPPGITNITSFGAIGDGMTDNATAIQNAIDAASAAGGGTVEIPAPGVYLCGPLTMMSKINLQVDGGATLRMLPYGVSSVNFITCSGLSDIEFSGSGTIDGQATTAGWWQSPTLPTSARPLMIYLTGCQRVLIQNLTLENPPKMHIQFKGTDSNITIQGITINTSPTSPNTDGIDLIGTACLVQNCSISDGDDNIALGSSSSVSSDTVITNCTFGSGHGVSIGSNTQGGVSNLTVIDCTFNGTDYGIRMKSNDAISGGSGEGGIVQNLSYLNIGMTNIVDGAIVIYSYYNSSAGGEFGTPTSVTPLFASMQAVDSTTIPVWRNIVFSNVTATVAAGGIPGIVWARKEVPATNIVFDKVNISASQPFGIYNAAGIQFADSQVTVPAGMNALLLYNAQISFTNSQPSTNLFTLDGLPTNSLAFYNSQAALQDTNVLAASPGITLGSSTLTIGNNLNLNAASVVNFVIGTNNAIMAVASNLVLSGIVNVSAGGGFTNTEGYALFTYGGNLGWGPPTLVTTPAGYNYAFDTNTTGLVKLLVSPPAPTGLHIVGP